MEDRMQGQGQEPLGLRAALPPELDRDELLGKLKELRAEINENLGSLFKNDNDHCFAFATAPTNWEANLPTLHFSKDFSEMQLKESLVRRFEEHDPKGTLYYFCLEFEGRGDDEGSIEFYLKEDTCEARTSLQKANIYKETRSGNKQTSDISEGMRLRNVLDLVKFNKACLEELS